MRKIPAVLVAGSLLSNCGGGGGGSPQLPAPVSGSPILAQAKAQVSIKIPNSVAASLRRPKYIPSNAGSVRIHVTSVNGLPPSPAIPDVIQALSPTAQGCSTTSGGLVCTVIATLPIASVTLSVSLYQSSDASGTALATNTVTANVASGVTTSIALTLGGVPATISLGGPIVTAADGTTKTIALPINVMDASGATIIAPGTYSAPVNLAISGDPNGALSLSSTTVTGPSATGQTAVTLTYNSSRLLTSATITATATGSTPATTQVNPLVYSPTSLPAMVINGLAGSITVSEANYAGAFTVGGASPNSATCVPANCTPATAGGQVTINVQPASIAGFVTMSVSDATNVTASVPLKVASVGGGPSVPGNPQFWFDALPTGQTSPKLPFAGSDGNIWFVESQGSFSYPATMSTSGAATAGISHFVEPAREPFVSLANIASAALGPDGDGWFVDSGHNQIDRVAPATLAISVSAVTAAISIPDIIAEGPDNLMWLYGTATGSPVIVEMAPNGTVATMALTGSTLGTVTSMISGPDGNMWFTQTAPSGVGKITPGGAVTLYTSGITGTPNPGLAIGADGCMWFTESTPNAVTKIRPSSGTITEYTSGISGSATSIGGIAEGGDGNIWFTEQGTGNVDRSTTNGLISEYFSGSGNQPTSLVLAPNGQLWFTEQTKASLGWLSY